jgi:POT family proton-dependent oligopeptide transporter
MVLGLGPDALGGTGFSPVENYTGVTPVPRATQRERNLALLIIFAVVVLFCVVFQQGSNTVQLWFRDCTERTAPAWVADWLPFLVTDGQLNKTVVSSINPFYVILFSLPLVWLWQRLRAAGLEPITPAKIGAGMLLTSLGFVVFLSGARAGADEPGVRVSMGYLLGSYVFITLGELLLNPLGLSLVTQLAAARSRSAWMGGWFTAMALGNYLSGILGAYWNTWRHSTFFGVVALAALAAFAILMFFYPRLRRAIPAPRPAPTPDERTTKPSLIAP